MIGRWRKTSRRMLHLPTMPAAIYAVGDIHGRFDLYHQIEQQIIEDAASIEGPKLLVILGDIVDRSAGVSGLIDHLLAPDPAGVQRVILCGNHDDMMCCFLEDPAGNRAWLDCGGAETLASYGLHLGEVMPPTMRLHHQLITAIPPDHRDFFMGLPLSLTVGDYVFAHASYNLDQTDARQDAQTLMWGDPALADLPKSRRILIHGHVIEDEPCIRPNRISIDTGAYKTGVLTAVRLLAGGCTPTFFSTKPK